MISSSIYKFQEEISK